MKGHVCIISSEMPREIRDSLSRDFDVFTLPPDPLLDKPVHSHPDMILCVVDDNLILPRGYYEAHHQMIDCITETCGYSLILSDAPRSSVYPHDVGMNVAVGKRFIICRTESTAPEIIEAAKEAGLEIIPVKQGYAGCSCIVTDKAVLTSDEGIHRALTERGIDSFYADKSGIALPGYDVGFIGGCGGFADRVLYFCGSLDSVACGTDVRRFAEMHGYEICELAADRLTDYGGIKIL
ncbi:MAG: hypothetical protein E7627_08995 [Ruminococcaceae bacterium]|nr:hypothetical protein [Oscillospiraceae bacterium]